LPRVSLSSLADLFPPPSLICLSLSLSSARTGKIRGPESVTLDRKRNCLFVGTLDGKIVKVWPSPAGTDIVETLRAVATDSLPVPIVWEAEEFVDIQGRPLGIHMDQKGENLIVCEAVKGLSPSLDLLIS